MKLNLVGAAVLAAVLVVPVSAADDDAKKKKGRRGQQNAATQLLKQLEKVGLTDEQIAKTKELGKAAAAEMKAIRDEAGITQELTKKRTEVQKSMKDSDKKGKDLVAAINKEAGFSEAQAASLVKANAVRMKFQRDVVALLTDEQKAKLPERLQRAAKAKGKGARKKKKDAA
jgi:hypothetical protein